MDYCTFVIVISFYYGSLIILNFIELQGILCENLNIYKKDYLDLFNVFKGLLRSLRNSSYVLNPFLRFFKSI